MGVTTNLPHFAARGGKATGQQVSRTDRVL
jgi:hypothetical protein